MMRNVGNIGPIGQPRGNALDIYERFVHLQDALEEASAAYQAENQKVRILLGLLAQIKAGEIDLAQVSVDPEAGTLTIPGMTEDGRTLTEAQAEAIAAAASAASNEEPESGN